MFGAVQCAALMRSNGTSIDERFVWVEKIIERAGRCGCQALVFPETFFLLNYSPQKQIKLAQTSDGPQIKHLRFMAKSHSIMLCGSFIERDGKNFYNSAFLIEKDGTLVGIYRKVHITPQWEKVEKGLTAGDSFLVFKTSIGVIGMMICIDLYFSESAQMLADAGADVIFLPLMNDGRGTDEWSTVVRTRAIDNSVNIIASVACPSTNFGLSMIVDRFGNILSRAAPNDDLTVAEINLDDYPLTAQPTGGYCGQKEPIVPLRDVLRAGRRPDVYHFNNEL